jgi:predicted alpha/beta hydrolase family esterase
VPVEFVHWTGGVDEQPPLLVAHSLMSLQVTPVPEYPAGQEPQVRLPVVFVHVTGGDAEQPPLLVAHSLTSVQVTPFPV